MKQFASNIYVIGFIVYCLIAGGLFFYINQSSEQINNQINQLISDFQTKRHSIAEMSEATKVRILLLVEMRGTDDAFEREELLTRFYQQGSRYLKARDKILSVKLNAEENAEMVRIWDAVVVTAPKLREVADLLTHYGSDEKAQALLQEVLPIQQNITRSFEKLIASISQQAANRQRILQDELINHQQLIFLLFVVSIVLAAFTLMLTQRDKLLLARATDEAMIEKNRAEEANQEKSRFLANMSHELRTPMHAILNFTVLALKRAEDPKQEKFLQNIRTSGIRLTSLLDDLLDLSKLEANKMDADFVYQDMTTLVESAVSEISSLATKKGILVNIDSNSHYECMFDQKLIFQVVVNLLSNAIKFSGENTTIQIDMKFIESTGKRSEPNMIRVSIADQGVGIPEDQVETVFDKFYQSSKTRSQAGGTGLGLPICREIINLHGGKIWAESSSGEDTHGSVFRFEIPVIQSSAEVISIPDIQTAIDSHLKWKEMIEAVARGDKNAISPRPMSEMNTHLCSLGKWIDSVDIGGSLFAELKRIHSEFHVLAGEVIAYRDAGQEHAKIEKLVEFQEASDQITRLLKSMQYHASAHQKAA